MLSYMIVFGETLHSAILSKQKIVAVPKTGGNATGDQSDTYRLRGEYGLLYPRGCVLVGLEGVGQ